MNIPNYNDQITEIEKSRNYFRDLYWAARELLRLERKKHLPKGKRGKTLRSLHKEVMREAFK